MTDDFTCEKHGIENCPMCRFYPEQPEPKCNQPEELKTDKFINHSIVFRDCDKALKMLYQSLSESDKAIFFAGYKHHAEITRHDTWKE
jgi:hypothetical protein